MDGKRWKEQPKKRSRRPDAHFNRKHFHKEKGSVNPSAGRVLAASPECPGRRAASLLGLAPTLRGGHTGLWLLPVPLPRGSAGLRMLQLCKFPVFCSFRNQGRCLLQGGFSKSRPAPLAERKSEKEQFMRKDDKIFTMM